MLLDGYPDASGDENVSESVLLELPSVEDRKRFLGCLAAVLASSCDYELCLVASVGGNRATSTTGTGTGTASASMGGTSGVAISNNSNNNNNMNDDVDKLPDWLETNTMSAQESDDHSNSHSHGNNSAMFLDALDDEGKLEDASEDQSTSTMNEHSERSIQSGLSQNHSDNGQHKRHKEQGSADRDHDDRIDTASSDNKNDNSASTIVEQELDNIHDQIQQQQQQRRPLGSRFQTWRQNRKEKRDERIHQQQQQQQAKEQQEPQHEDGEGSSNPTGNNTNNTNNSATSPVRMSARQQARLVRRAARKQAKQRQKEIRLSRAQQEFRRAQERHVIRRHQVAEKFLRQAMEHLFGSVAALQQAQRDNGSNHNSPTEDDVMTELEDELLPLLDKLKELPPQTTSGVTTAGNPTPSMPQRPSRFSLHRLSTGGTNSSLDAYSSDDNDNDHFPLIESTADNCNESPLRPSTPASSTAQPGPEQLLSSSNGNDKFGGKLTNREWADHDITLRQYLTALSPGAGFHCLASLLLQHLLHPKTNGYDARTRFALKTLGVAVLVQDMERVKRAEFIAKDIMMGKGKSESDATDDSDDNNLEERYHEWKTQQYTDWAAHATRKFENLEHVVADRLLRLASQPPPQQTHGDNRSGVSIDDLEADDDVEFVTVAQSQKTKRRGPSKKQIVRGLKIGGAGLVAGTLLAVTGGLAAPAIAAGLTALGMGAVATTFLSLASTTAVVHLFGVAGGSLAAYKMNRRTAGLTEFTIRQETNQGRGLRKRGHVHRHQQKHNHDNHASHSLDDLEPDELNPNYKTSRKQQPQPKKGWFGRRQNQPSQQQNNDQHQEEGKVDQTVADNVELSRTICVSGWLQDAGAVDFQRPWGVQPNIKTPLEKLQRFYAIHNPSIIPYCENLWKRWKKEVTTFFSLLEDKYGSSPNTLFPLSEGPMLDDALTQGEEAIVDRLILEIGDRKWGSSNTSAKARSTQPNSTAAQVPPKTEAPAPHVGEESTSKLQKFQNQPLVLTVPDDQYDHSGAVDTYHTIDDDASSPRHYEDEELACPNHYASVFEQVPPLKSFVPPAHLDTVWDYGAQYGGELYTVQWESAILGRLCACVREIAVKAVSNAGQDVVYHIVGSTFALFLYLPVVVLQAMNSIDETWTLVVNRADEAGRELARSLLINTAGHRPVTLVGYSFGARVIYSCLKTLAVYQEQWEDVQEERRRRATLGVHEDEDDNDAQRRDRKKKRKPIELEFDREPASVVEDVVLMGAPFYLSLSSWKACRQVVAGRLVNVYSRKDKILSLMFKYKQIYQSHKPVCGTCTISVPGVENVDVSDIIESHSDYCFAVGKCLQQVRHGQPFRSASTALDEEAILAAAEKLAQQQKQRLQEQETEGESAS